MQTLPLLQSAGQTALLLLFLTLTKNAVGKTVQDANASVPLTVTGGYVLPLIYNPLTAPVPMIQVSINNKPPLPFAIDTASDLPLVIDRWAAEKLGVVATDEPLVRTPITVYKATVGSVELMGLTSAGSVLIKMETAGIADFGVPKGAIASVRMAGVVGLPVLAQTIARFDFAAKTLTLFLGPRTAGTAQNPTLLPLIHLRRLFAVNVSIGDEASADLVVDTGSYHSAVPEAIASRLTAIGIADSAGWQIGGKKIYRSRLVPMVQLGTFKEPNVVLDTAPDSDKTGVLGLNLLTRFRVTLDFARCQMQLERARDYADGLRLPGARDVSVGDDGGTDYVETVEAGSAAYRAGVHKGDRIIQVDGQLLDGRSGAVAQSLLEGFAGTKAEVLLQRGKGQRITVTYTRASLFSGALK